jgi:hypothetical protein
VEKTLIDQLNLHYLHAHQIATRAEQAAVRAGGVRWRDYDRFMQKYVKRIISFCSAARRNALTGEREKALAAGCNEFDTKPIEFDRLVTTVRRILANRK